MSATALFDTVPEQDYLALFDSGTARPDYQKVVKLLEFKKKDVARATNVRVALVRYDQKIPKELAERITEWAVVLAKVADYFQDSQKTILWFRTPNPLLGNVAPREMLRVGRFKKLHRFIMNALSENKRDAA